MRSRSVRYLSSILRAERFEPRCAYCHSPERLLGFPLELDHIVPVSAGGRLALSNLCLCCRSCNAHKSRQTHAKDYQTGRRVRLYHPRRQPWARHFVWSRNGTRILGLTATGRTTVDALQMNNDLIVSLRELWVALNLHPRELPRV